MHAIVIHEHGGSDVLSLEQIPEPVPGPGEIRVEVASAAVNRLDIWVRENEGHAYRVRLPRVPGYDVAGRVLECGAGVIGFAPGDRVYVHCDRGCRRCEHCLDGEEACCARYELMGVHRDGGYAEQVVAPAENVFQLTDGVAFEDASAAGSVYHTAYHMLFARGRLRAGETVLIAAAGSGVGGAALALARLAGARVIATAGSAGKRARSLEEGAEAAVDYTVPGWSEAVREASGGRGVDLAIEHTGGERFGEVVRALAPRGRVVFCGATGGREAGIDLVDCFTRQISVLGSNSGTRRELLEVLKLLARGLVAPRIDTVLPLARAAEAQARLEARDHYGRIVLAPRRGEEP